MTSTFVVQDMGIRTPRAVLKPLPRLYARTGGRTSGRKVGITLEMARDL
jgi:hypothetical protein